jgi:hypothetical protein
MVVVTDASLLVAVDVVVLYMIPGTEVVSIVSEVFVLVVYWLVYYK